jgi:hypothetical protein
MTLNERKILRRASIIQTTFPLVKDSPIRRTSPKSIVRDGIPSTKIAQECAGARPDLLNTDTMDVARGKHHNELKMAPMKMAPPHQYILITIKTVLKRNEIQRPYIHLNIFDAVTALTWFVALALLLRFHPHEPSGCRSSRKAADYPPRGGEREAGAEGESQAFGRVHEFRRSYVSYQYYDVIGLDRKKIVVRNG